MFDEFIKFQINDKNLSLHDFKDTLYEYLLSSKAKEELRHKLEFN